MFSGSFIGNLLGTVYFALFISGGIYISLKMFSFSSFQKIWLGTVIGIALLMWLPMVSSVLLGFNILSHTVALLLLAGLDFCAWFFNKKNKGFKAVQDKINELISGLKGCSQINTKAGEWEFKLNTTDYEKTIHVFLFDIYKDKESNESEE